MSRLVQQRLNGKGVILLPPPPPRSPSRRLEFPKDLPLPPRPLSPKRALSPKRLSSPERTRNIAKPLKLKGGGHISFSYTGPSSRQFQIVDKTGHRTYLDLTLDEVEKFSKILSL